MATDRDAHQGNDIESIIISLVKQLHEQLGGAYVFDLTISARKQEGHHLSRATIEMKVSEEIVAGEARAAGTRTVNTTTVVDYLPREATD